MGERDDAPKTCVYLCAPHLDFCVLERGHEDDCLCGDDRCAQLREASIARWRYARERHQ